MITMRELGRRAWRVLRDQRGQFPSFEFDVDTPTVESPSIPTGGFSFFGGDSGSNWLSNLGSSLKGAFGGGSSGAEGSARALDFASMASPNVGGGGDSGGGFWKSVSDWLYTPGNKTTGESPGGILGTAGNLASAVTPLFSLGAGLMGAFNQQKMIDQAAKLQPIREDVMQTQLASARQGQQLAGQAAEVSPEVKALAPRMGELSGEVQQTATPLGQMAGDVRTRVANPQIEYGNKLLQLADAGALLDADQAALDEWEQKAIADAEGYLARSGQGDSSARETVLRQIRGEKASKHSQLLAQYRTQAQQYIQGGGSAMTQGAGQLTKDQINALVNAGLLTQSQAAMLLQSVSPLASAGAILSGSVGAAGQAGAAAAQEQAELERMLAALNQQLSVGAGRA